MLPPLGKNNARGSAKMLVKFQPIDTICPSSPTGRGDKLKPCTVKVRILRGVPCLRGGIGRRIALKMRCPLGVWVRVPPKVPVKENNYDKRRIKRDF